MSSKFTPRRSVEDTLHERVDAGTASLSERSAVVALKDYEPRRTKAGEHVLVHRISRVASPIEDAAEQIRRALILGGSKMPSQQVIAEAIELLRVIANEQETITLYVRTTKADDGYHIYDTGVDGEGPVGVLIGPAQRAEWTALPADRAFERPGGQKACDIVLDGTTAEDFLSICDHLPIDEDTAAAIAGWAVCSLLDVQAPIILIEAQQSAGKSVATKRLVELLDRQHAPVRTTFKTIEDLALAAGATLSFGIDNLSGLSLETSDALCMLTTGAAYARRTLYSDKGMTVMKFRRAIVANGIDMAGIRGDLASRAYTVQLKPIERREAESDLDARWEEAVPHIRGALMHLACRVLAEMEEGGYPDDIADVHRIVDFSKVVAMVDWVLATDGLDSIRRSKAEASGWVVDGDMVAQAILSMLDETSPDLPADMPRRAAAEGRWEGTTKELLDALQPHYRDDRKVPKTPKVMGARLRRIIPVLAEAGVTVTEVRVGPNRQNGWLIERTDQPADC